MKRKRKLDYLDYLEDVSNYNFILKTFEKKFDQVVDKKKMNSRKFGKDESSNLESSDKEASVISSDESYESESKPTIAVINSDSKSL